MSPSLDNGMPTATRGIREAKGPPPLGATELSEGMTLLSYLGVHQSPCSHFSQNRGEVRYTALKKFAKGLLFLVVRIRSRLQP